MESDKNGCSTCETGKESYEEYYSATLRKNLIQYDYRTTEGELFSTYAASLERCRERRDLWLEKINK